MATATAPAPPATTSVRAEAEAIVAQEYFHQTFNIPATADHEELTFSYSDVGLTPDVQPDGATVPVVLFHPGLFASRYIAVSLHSLAKHLGVRMIVIDRPGFGKSTNVPVEKRVDIWVELVPRLLSHLNIPHVTIVSHCAGTVYALNILYRCRDILDPERPTAVLLAPWVDPQHSKVAIMLAAQYIPSSAYSLFNGLSRFAARGMLTTVSSSEAVLSTFGLSKPSEEEERVAKSWNEANNLKIEKECGVSVPLQLALNEQTMRHIFSESTDGSNDEARHCARKAPQGSWGRAEDYSVYVTDLAALERSRDAANGNRDTAAKLTVMAFFATTDSIVGNGGREYVEKCWRGTSEGCDDAFDFTSRIIDGSDHDGLVLSFEMWSAVVDKIRGARPRQ